MNLPELVAHNVSEASIVALANTLGQPVQRIWAGISAAVPAVLCFYAEKISTPDGADELFDAMRGRDPAVLDHLPESLGGAQGHKMIEDGQQLFSSLFRRESTDDLAQAVSQFGAMGFTSARALLGASNLIALATLNRASQAQNGHELASFIDESKPSIIAAIPEGLREYLDNVPLLHRVSHQYDQGVPATGSDDEMDGEAAMHRQENRHNERYYRADHDRVPASMVWIIPTLVLIAAAAALVFSLHPTNTNDLQPIGSLRPADRDVTPDAQPAAGLIPGTSALQELALPDDPTLGRDLAAQVREFAQTLRSAPAPLMAQNAPEKLTKMRLNLDAINDRFNRLPISQQRLLVDRLNPLLPALQVSAENAMSNPANATIGEKIDGILQSLRQMARQQT